MKFVSIIAVAGVLLTGTSFVCGMIKEVHEPKRIVEFFDINQLQDSNLSEIDLCLTEGEGVNAKKINTKMDKEELVQKLNSLKVLNNGNYVGQELVLNPNKSMPISATFACDNTSIIEQFLSANTLQASNAPNNVNDNEQNKKAPSMPKGYGSFFTSQRFLKGLKYACYLGAASIVALSLWRFAKASRS
jgi:hypothetical protein